MPALRRSGTGVLERNTVDTLQQTRLLKRMGIEVYFTEDGIWTMNDEDGELRLTIMATLAQNESKKTSMRVKAGQMVSFQNGVVYGTGNVLGYDKVGPEYVINEAQAKTVRKIFDMYLAGNGSQKIKRQLEKDGDLTAMGKSLWHYATISHILKNRLYCGELEYRKEYVPDYLEQKRAKNKGELERVIVEGKHQPIVTKEEFERVQKMMAEGLFGSPFSHVLSFHNSFLYISNFTDIFIFGSENNKLESGEIR